MPQSKFRPSRMIFAVLLLAAGALTACGNSVSGSGVVREEIRSLSGFTRVDSRASADVQIRLGAADSVVVSAEDNLLPYIVTTVENGTLVIDGKSGTSISPTRPMLVTVTLAEISDVTLSGSGNITLTALTTPALTLSSSGSGNITADELTTPTLTTAMSGSGKVTVSGTLEKQYVTLAGSGVYDTSLAPSTDAVVNISGSGDVMMNVGNTIDATITGSGDVLYLGDAIVTRNITGDGEVRPR